MFPHRQFSGSVSVLALQWQLAHPPLKRAALSVLHGSRGGQINQSTPPHSQESFYNIKFEHETRVRDLISKEVETKTLSADIPQHFCGFQVGFK